MGWLATICPAHLAHRLHASDAVHVVVNAADVHATPAAGNHEDNHVMRALSSSSAARWRSWTRTHMASVLPALHIGRVPRRKRARPIKAKECELQRNVHARVKA